MRVMLSLVFSLITSATSLSSFFEPLVYLPSLPKYSTPIQQSVFRFPSSSMAYR